MNGYRKCISVSEDDLLQRRAEEEQCRGQMSQLPAELRMKVHPYFSDRIVAH